jgi:hypothetical protein
MATYFMLNAEETGIRPPYGLIAIGDDNREIVRNTDALWTRVLEIAEQIRAARHRPVGTIHVNQPAAKCRGCGVRDRVGQRSE